MSRIKKTALLRSETVEGGLHDWWLRRYEGRPPTVPFRDRTVGGLLREIYESAAHELVRLRDADRDEATEDDEKRRAQLERVFSEDAQDEIEGNMDSWYTPRYTGDPEIDRWEAQVARGETPDLERAG